MLMKYRRFVIPVVTASVLLAVGFTIGRMSDGTSSSVTRERDLVNQAGGQLTNPLLACGDIDNLTVGEMERLKNSVQQIVDRRTKAGDVRHVSVYVRDLNNGPWFGLNEKDFFYPASLLKVPLLLAAYRAEEDNPGFLDRTVLFEKALLPTTQLFPPAEQIQQGKSYTLRELLRRAIIFSDNEATALLAVHVGQKYALKIFSDFGIERPQPDEDYQMRVRTYASFFRVLYNASYLSRAHSEEALSILAEVDFEDGLKSAVPRDVLVAHKFGEREGGISDNDYQLHDCGIVYTESPYLICIMAQGKSTDGMVATISEIAKKVYKEIGS